MVFLQPPRAIRTTTTCFCIVLFAFVMMSGGVRRPTTSSRGGFFLLGAEAAELVIGWGGLAYTVDNNSTIQETKDSEPIGPYYLSYHAQLIKDEFTVPYDWDDYLQDFQSYMAEFCETYAGPDGDDWTKFIGYAFTPSTGGTRVTSDTFMTKYLEETINDNDAPVAGRLEKVEKTVKDMCGIHAVLRYLYLSYANVNDDTNWDRAAAVYYGQDMLGSLYHRSEYLGGQFGTTSGGNSATNVKINAAFRQGKQSSSTATKAEKYEIIEHQMRIVYAQGIIKYALQMDHAIAEKTATKYMEAQAEGQAFARILTPWVTEPKNATALEAMFDTSKEPRGYAHYNYCAAKAILQSDINGGISDEEIGTYDHMDEIICPTIDAHKSNLGRSGTDTYTPQSIVGPDLSVSQAVSQVKTLLGDSSDYAIIKETYTELGLRALADTDHTGEPVWDDFKAYFGSTTWISDFIDQICDGTTLSSHPGARAELLEKTVMDALQVQAIISDLYQGYKNEDQDKWDQGAAKFHGAGDSYDSTVFARGDKRAANYATTQSGNVAKANSAIATALASGETEANYNTVLKHIKIIYAQATIRYAWLIDRDVVEGTDYREHQAEGLAFFRVIAPWVKSIDSSGYDTVSQIFDTTKRPFSVIGHSYCLVEQIVTDALSISNSDLGSLEDASSLASCSNVATSKVISEGDTTLFTATTDIGASLETSNLVSDVKAILDVTSPNFAAIKAKYRSDGLRGMADADRSGEPAYNLFYAYYASKTWISDFLYRATDGTATSNSEPARLEAVEKTMWDATMVNAIASDLYRGISDKNAWDAAAAKYFGKATTRSTTIYGRANKRAANFGTLSSDGVTAKVNAAISAAFKSGQSQNNHDIILKSIKTIYAQCAVRYGLMLDQDVASGADYREHQAEGWAFWRVLAPWVSEVDSSGVQVLDYMFNTATTPNHANHYCFAVNVVKNLNIAAEDMGVHEGAPSLDSCVGIEPTIIGATPSSGFTHFAAKSMFFVYFAATFLVASLALCAL